MLNIKLDDTFKITSDQFNVILNQKRKKGDGFVKQYYPNLKMALESYQTLSVNAGLKVIDSLDKYLEELDKRHMSVLEVLKDVKTKEDIF